MKKLKYPYSSEQSEPFIRMMISLKSADYFRENNEKPSKIILDAWREEIIQECIERDRIVGECFNCEHYSKGKRRYGTAICSNPDNELKFHTAKDEWGIPYSYPNEFQSTWKLNRCKNYSEVLVDQE